MPTKKIFIYILETKYHSRLTADALNNNLGISHQWYSQGWC
jgi:hypothetical protein